MAFSSTPIGTRFFGTGAPAELPSPVGYVGYDAVDTGSGDLYTCTGSGWLEAGNIKTTYLGMLARKGGSMVGQITGITGWAPTASPAFTSSATLDGHPLVTDVQLSSSQSSVLNSIAPKIAEAVASTTSAINVRSKIAIASGVLDFTGDYGTGTPTSKTIPLPTYPDSSGTTADEADCKWLVSVTQASTPHPTSGTTTMKFQHNGTDVDPTTTRTFSAFTFTDGFPHVYGCKVAYIIIGVKS